MRLLSLFVLILASPACVPVPCDFPVRCVDSCATRNEVSFMCGACPVGSVPISSCIDAGATEDASVPPD
jgi:hypothetical protein